ncbi:MAG: PPC domain-containing protein [Planctomycetes bacterium]|nr:PPC domain-containing protein [Planctomycetota bacterium]
MKRVAFALALAGVWTLGLGNGWAGEKPKVLEVGKGLKVEAKITNDDERQIYKFDRGGREISLNMRAKEFTVQLEAGTKYTVTMDTDDPDFDPFLVVKNKLDRVVDFDDDSGGFLNAKLSFTPVKDGIFKISAAALRGTGSFTFKISPGKGDKVPSVGKNGLTIKGSLKDDRYKVAYQVKLRAGKTYRIDLKSTDFDAFLYLHDADGKKLAEDDDSGGGLDSRITYKAAADGIYVFTATSLGMSGTGDFVLVVREED